MCIQITVRVKIDTLFSTELEVDFDTGVGESEFDSGLGESETNTSLESVDVRGRISSGLFSEVVGVEM